MASRMLGLLIQCRLSGLLNTFYSLEGAVHGLIGLCSHAADVTPDL